jgi:hypothetical protein
MPGTFNTLVEPWDYRTNPNPDALYYVCPHCQSTVEQHPENFHYWCPECGKNATEPVQG